MVDSKKQNIKKSIDIIEKDTFLNENMLSENLDKEAKREPRDVHSPEIKPIIKWAGGKRLLLKDIIMEFPSTYNNYFEPFAGGGALFFGIKHNGKQITINDINPKLVNLYIQLKTNPLKLMVLLDLYQQLHSEDFYYKVRSKFSENNITKIELAAMFLYLNKAGFNGLYRENSKGFFNVPFGKKDKISLYEQENYLKASDFLQRVNILNERYEDVLKDAKKGDLIYLDPPYYPIKDNSFTKYSKNGFSKEDHLNLFNIVNDLTQKGVFCIISNSNSEFIKDLFKEYKIKTLSLSRSINSKSSGRKKEENEILISNVDIVNKKFSV